MPRSSFFLFFLGIGREEVKEKGLKIRKVFEVRLRLFLKDLADYLEEWIRCHLCYFGITVLKSIDFANQPL